jgi:hypothetical protein
MMLATFLRVVQCQRIVTSANIKRKSPPPRWRKAVIRLGYGLLRSLLFVRAFFLFGAIIGRTWGAF